MSVKYDLNELPELRVGEPWFFLRGQDALAPHALQAYANLLRAAAVGRGRQWLTVDSSDRALQLRDDAAEVERIAARMIAWQAEHGSKLPD